MGWDDPVEKELGCLSESREVVHGRVVVGNESCTSLIIHIVGQAWSGHLGDRDDRVDLIGSGN